MSHFSVLVYGPTNEQELEKLMMPFHEFECTGIEQYIQDIDISEEVVSEWKASSEYSTDSFSAYVKDYYGYELFTGEEFHYADTEDIKYGYAIDNEDGSYKVIKRTNPNKKWDWYVVGGRWSNNILGKDGNRHDSLRKGDIDITGMENESIKRVLADYDKVMNEAKLLFGENYLEKIMDFKDWKTIRNEVKDIDRDVDTTRDVYHNQNIALVFKSLKDKGDNSWFFVDYSDYVCTREEKIEKARKLPKMFFAYLGNDGWHERGEMGWWASVSNEQTDWDVKAASIFDSIPDDTVVTVVDCHI